jgi:PPOX class probable F420-dependent enzyme
LLAVSADEGGDVVSAPATAEDASAQEAADGYFSALVPAKYVLVTTFKWGRTPVSSPVRMMVQGDRAYFRAWSRSPAWKRLRHNNWVQVAPCTALGLYRRGPWLDATARMLAGEEAGRAAKRLAWEHLGRLGGLASLAHRLRGTQLVHYELQPAGGQASD